MTDTVLGHGHRTVSCRGGLAGVLRRVARAFRMLLRTPRAHTEAREAHDHNARTPGRVR